MSVGNFTTNNMSSYSDRMLEHVAQNASSEALQEKLNIMAATMGDEAFTRLAAREIVARTQPQRAIP
ncbi:MAG: hypothetical protein U5R30_11330 [Deltaproteobacteria bacterium]|nr:hypothetical protein [Deltaproteobacteria bacterium]